MCIGESFHSLGQNLPVRECPIIFDWVNDSEYTFTSVFVSSQGL